MSMATPRPWPYMIHTANFATWQRHSKSSAHIRERRVRAEDQERRLLLRSPFSADPGTRYRVRKPFLAYGKNYALGEEDRRP